MSPQHWCMCRKISEICKIGFVSSPNSNRPFSFTLLPPHSRHAYETPPLLFQSWHFIFCQCLVGSFNRPGSMSWGSATLWCVWEAHFLVLVLCSNWCLNFKQMKLFSLNNKIIIWRERVMHTANSAFKSGENAILKFWAATVHLRKGSLRLYCQEGLPNITSCAVFSNNHLRKGNKWKISLIFPCPSFDVLFSPLV